MNKTITINLGGVIFNIEEDAFNRLKEYLDRLKSRFTTEDGRDEIIADIESRMAELLNERLHPGKSALQVDDIDAVIVIMGKPEDYGESTSNSDQSNAAGQDAGAYDNVRNKNRKLYRDTDDAVVGGVCAGISHYLGWDPSILRILLVLAVLFGGTGVLLYIILWAVIPAAKSRAEKLQMRGEAVNIDNLSKMVKEEMSDFEDRINSKKSRKFGSEIGEKARDISESSGRIIGLIFGGILVIIALGLILSMIGALVGMNVGGPFNSDNFSLSYADRLLFTGDGSLMWLVIAGFVMIIAPIILMLYAGIKLLLNIKTRVRGLGLGLGLLFFIGLLGSIILGTRVGREFSRDAQSTQRHRLEVTGDTLFVGVNPNPYFPFDVSRDEREFFELIKETDSLRAYGETVSMHFESTDDEFYSMEIFKESNGSTTTKAYELLERTSYGYSIEPDSVHLNTYLSTPKSDPFRAQCIEIRIMVPKGKWVSFGEGLQRIYWNDSNIGRTRQMGDETWMDDNLQFVPDHPKPPAAPEPPASGRTSTI